MPVRVLIVDDSGFFRHRISDLLEGDSRITVVGTAQNGQEAIEQAKKLKPDMITMDVEMPLMNGIEAVRVIMRESPTNILMLSSLTQEGAQVTLQALEAGAIDFLSKDLRAWMDHSPTLQNQLRDKVVEIGRSRVKPKSTLFTPSGSDTPPGARVFRSTSSGVNESASRSNRSSSTARLPSHNTFKSSKNLTPEPVRQTASRPVEPVSRRAGTSKQPSSLEKPDTGAVEKKLTPPTSRLKGVPHDCRLVVIGSSTGGPTALQQILMELPANFPYPILLVQHMPKTFTSVFAQRLNQQCNIAVKEAEDGDKLEPGRALLAPGGEQMIIDPRQKDRIRIMPSDERLTYKPSVDVSYASAAKSYGHQVLAIILTGMGADGCDGAKMLKQQGAEVWAQNRESCTIFGMPQAIINAGLADHILDLSEFGTLLNKRRTH